MKFHIKSINGLAGLLLLALLPLISGCLSDDNPQDQSPDFISDFTFLDNAGGWVQGYTDYPLDSGASLDFTFNRQQMPNDTSEYGLRISGRDNNRDLFMYMWREIGPLEANTTYDLVITVDFIGENLETDTEQDDSPGNVVYLKAGAVNFLPSESISADDTELGYIGIVPNFDKGNDANSGTDMLAFGTLTLPNAGQVNDPVVSVFNSVPFRITTNSQGNLYLLVGTDSQSDLHHAIIYDRIFVSYTKVTI